MLAFDYKDHTAETEFDWLELRWTGRVTNITAEISFSGATVDEAERAFKKAVDAHIAAEGELGKAA